MAARSTAALEKATAAARQGSLSRVRRKGSKPLKATAFFSEFFRTAHGGQIGVGPETCVSPVQIGGCQREDQRAGGTFSASALLGERQVLFSPCAAASG